MAKAGGTSVSDDPGSLWLLVAVLVAPPAALAIHYVGSAGGDLGWDYASLGGAGRAILLLSILGGLASGLFAGLAFRAHKRELSSRGVFVILALATVTLACLGARQFANYGASSRRAGDIEMSPTMCAWVRETLPACIDTAMGTNEGDIVRRSQPSCFADAASIATYQRCMPVEGCLEIIDCITASPSPDPESSP